MTAILTIIFVLTYFIFYFHLYFYFCSHFYFYFHFHSHPCLKASGMTSCSPGTYNSKYALGTTCPSCPSGFYCPNSTMTSYDQFLCTRGHFCGVGTIIPSPCEPGSFSNAKGNKVIGDCLSCTAGNYCSTQGD